MGLVNGILKDFLLVCRFVYNGSPYLSYVFNNVFIVSGNSVALLSCVFMVHGHWCSHAPKKWNTPFCFYEFLIRL